LFGRINRARYWAYVTAALALCTIVWIFSPTGPYFSVFTMFICVPRLHDIGRSGWFALGFSSAEIELATQLFPYRPPPFIEVPTAGTMVLAAVVVGAFIWLGVIPGQPGANKFGPPCPPGLRGVLS
jgi:uncharacterized membrane protein YhaH (DUF805 family)